MELILKKDVEHVGFADDVVTVKPGYGRNFLIPHGFAIMATSGAKKQLAETLKQRAHKEASVVSAAKEQATKLAELEIKIKAKTGEGDKIFGSVNAGDVADAVNSKGFSIDKKFISIPGGSIKRLGSYEASVRFHRDVNAILKFDIIAEKEKATEKATEKAKDQEA